MRRMIAALVLALGLVAGADAASVGSEPSGVVITSNVARGLDHQLGAMRWSPVTDEIALLGEHGVTVRASDSLHEMYSLGRAATAIAWSGDGKRFAAAGNNRSVQLWTRMALAKDFEYGVSLRWDEAEGDVVVRDIQFSPTCKRIAAASNKWLRIWDLEAGPGDKSIPGAWDSVSWSVDGKQLAAIKNGPDGNKIQLLDAETGMVEKIIQSTAKSLQSVSWSTDGKTLAAIATPDSVLLWKPSGEPLGALCEDVEVSILAWNPNGRHLAVAGQSASIHIWDTFERKRVVALSGHIGGGVPEIAWSPDGTQLASAGRSDLSLRVWDVAKGLPAIVASKPRR